MALTGKWVKMARNYKGEYNQALEPGDIEPDTIDTRNQYAPIKEGTAAGDAARAVWQPGYETLLQQMGAIQGQVDIYKGRSPLSADTHMKNIATSLARDYGIKSIGDIGVRQVPYSEMVPIMGGIGESEHIAGYERVERTIPEYFNKNDQTKIIPAAKFASEGAGDGYSNYNLQPIQQADGSTIVVPVQQYSKSGLGAFVEDLGPVLPLINVALSFAGVPPLWLAAGNVALQTGAGNVKNIGDALEVAAPFLIPAAVKELAAGTDLVGSDWATSGAGTSAATIPADVAAGLSSSAVGQAVSNLSNQALTGLAADVVGSAALSGLSAAIFDKDIGKFVALGGVSALASGAGKAVFDATGNRAYANAVSSSLNALAETGEIERAILYGGVAGVTTLVNQTVTNATKNPIIGQAAQLGAVSAITGQPVATGDLIDLGKQVLDYQTRNNAANDSSAQTAPIVDGTGNAIPGSAAGNDTATGGSAVEDNIIQTDSGDAGADEILTASQGVGQVLGSGTQFAEADTGTKTDATDYRPLPKKPSEMTDEELLNVYIKRDSPDFIPSSELSVDDLNELADEYEKRFTKEEFETGTNVGTGTGTDTSTEPTITSLIGANVTGEGLKKFISPNGQMSLLGNLVSGIGRDPEENEFFWTVYTKAVNDDGTEEYRATDRNGNVYSIRLKVIAPDEPPVYEIWPEDNPNQKVQVSEDQAKTIIPENAFKEIKKEEEKKEVEKEKVEPEVVKKTPEQIAKAVRDNNSKAVETRASELIDGGLTVDDAIARAASEYGLTADEYDAPAWSRISLDFNGSVSGGADTVPGSIGGDTTAGVTDTITSGGGNDTGTSIGEGADTIAGGGGENTAPGGIGSDTILDGGDTSGVDTISGEADTTLGETDSITSGGENDTVNVGDGEDTDNKLDDNLDYDWAEDTLTGNKLDTVVIQGKLDDNLGYDWAEDTLAGGSKTDTIVSGGGTDTVTSGGGADTIVSVNLADRVTTPVTQPVAAPSETSAKPADTALPVTKIGETGKFVSPLEGYQQMVQKMYDTAMDEKLQQAPAAYQNPTEDSFWSYGQQKPLESIFGAFNSFFSEPEVKKAEGGAIAALMAVGGASKTGRGSTTLVPHSGKMRVDFRRGDAVTGPGDGQSDDIPAMLADGEFVFPADVVSALGNGSTKAGSDKLYEMMHAIRARARKAHPKSLPPPAKSPLEYLRGKK